MCASDNHTQKMKQFHEGLSLWKQQDVATPFVKKVLEVIKKYTKEAMGECNFTDQLLSAPPLNYIITHKVLYLLSHNVIEVAGYFY